MLERCSWAMLNFRWIDQYRENLKARRFSKTLKGFDPEAREIIERVRTCTMLPADMIFALVEAVRYVHRSAIPGAIVECGVWRGGAVMAAAMTFGKLGAWDRTFYLYDTFTGMTEPDKNDVSVDGKTDPRIIFKETQTGPDSSDWCRAGIEEVRGNLAITDYDLGRFVTVQGKVEDTIPATLPSEIAILRLDTDWYSSTQHEMVHLFPRLVSKGVLIVDDYHTWAGSRRAVDEYLDAARIPILLKKISGGAMGVKP